MRTFRKMIYEKYFSKEYLEVEEKKKELEEQIVSCMKKKDFVTGRKLLDELGTIS